MLRPSIHIRGVKAQLRRLDQFKRKAVPYAIKNTLNRQAFETRARWQGEIRATFMLKNKFSVNSIRVDKVRSRNPDTMQAVVGSVADYMGLQERGGLSYGGAGQKSIPTAVAARQPLGTARTRKVVKSRLLSSIQVTRTRRKGSRKQRNAIAMNVAKRKGERFALLERRKGGDSVGMFWISGSVRNLKATLLWSFHEAATIQPEPTLARSMNALKSKYPKIYAVEVVKQLKMHGLI